MDVRGYVVLDTFDMSKVYGGGPSCDGGAYGMEAVFEALQYAANPGIFIVKFKLPKKVERKSLMFSKPQYNSWIELTNNQNQADGLKNAKSIIDNGFEPGVLMIDDTWQEDYSL